MSGFGNLQEIDMVKQFYTLPYLFLASGFERLMKCYLTAVHKGSNGKYLTQEKMKSIGHDLDVLLDNLCSNYYRGMQRPRVKRDFEFIRKDRVLKKCMSVLSQFGKKGRYYNLDVVAGIDCEPIAPENEWKNLVISVEDPSLYYQNLDRMYDEYYPRANSKLIAKMERLVRAIAFQFTIEQHFKLDKSLKSLSVVFSNFNHLGDDQLGTVDYRRSVKMFRATDHKWISRTEAEIAKSPWPSRTVSRENFDGEWPFRADRVIIQCRERLFCIVNIRGYDFALNGAANMKLGIPFAADAGMAVLGRSLDPFMKMALRLSK